MRVIKFRGKRLDNGQWVCGTPVRSFPADPQLDGIIEDGVSDFPPRPINPATLGQYTGLRDINGKEIYKGDIIKSELKPCKPSADPTPILGVVEWWDERAEFVVDSTSYDDCRYVMNFATLGEVLGNIHDNPELLKGDEE